MKPLLKWVGGKRQLISQILPFIPKNMNIYHEPFFGGGAMLFELHPKIARINDLNEELINVYKTIHRSPHKLIELLRMHKDSNNRDYFYEVRKLDRDLDSYRKLTKVERAARTIYLNKTCYNGLYRVNKKGEFNTPFGKYKNPKICDEKGIYEIHHYFKHSIIEICNGDFEKFLNKAQAGDFVYLDPPYDPISETAYFTDYQASGFSKEEQLRLKKVCDELHNKGVKFLLSNSDTEFINDIYKEYTIKKVLAPRNINSKGDKRGKISEVIIMNY